MVIIRRKIAAPVPWTRQSVAGKSVRVGWRRASPGGSRTGSASIDYVLVLGTLATLGGLALYLGSKIIRLAYDMVCAFVGWPFL